MRSILAKLAVVALVTIGTLVAQSAHPGPDPQKQVNHLTRKLALTADQQSQILPILTDRKAQVEGVNTDTTLTPKQRNAKLKAVRADSESRLRNVLTDTQRAAYDQMREQERERARTKKLTGTAVQ